MYNLRHLKCEHKVKLGHRCNMPSQHIDRRMPLLTNFRVDMPILFRNNVYRHTKTLDIEGWSASVITMIISMESIYEKSEERQLVFIQLRNTTT